MYKNFDNSNYIPTIATLKLMVFNDDNEEVFSYVGLKAKIEIKYQKAFGQWRWAVRSHLGDKKSKRESLLMMNNEQWTMNNWTIDKMFFQKLKLKFESG